MGLKLHHVKSLPKVGEWVIWEKLAICNTFRGNSHLLFLSRWAISYGSETSPSESSLGELLCRDTLKIKNFVEIALCSTVFEILAFLCFAIFAQKFENSKWPPFLARQNFFENWHGYSAEIPSGSKISSKSLYLARFSRYKHFCVLQFCEKFKMAAIFCEKFFVWKLAWLLCRDTLRVKNFVEIALSSRVFEI